jgi:hypothetical protein
MMRFFLAVTCLLMLVSACDMVVMPWNRTSLKEGATRPLSCEAGADCDKKWSRAFVWVRNRSPLLIAVHTDSQIKTAGAPFASPDPTITVTKTLMQDDIYAIDFSADCVNSLGCAPPVIELKNSFIDYVGGVKKQ